MNEGHPDTYWNSTAECHFMVLLQQADEPQPGTPMPGSTFCLVQSASWLSRCCPVCYLMSLSILLGVLLRVAACCPSGYSALHCTLFSMLSHKTSISMYVTQHATQHYAAHYQKHQRMLPRMTTHVTQHITAWWMQQRTDSAYLEWLLLLLRAIICTPPWCGISITIVYCRSCTLGSDC